MSPEEFFRRLEQRPWAFDFFQALRRVEALYPAKPRLGRGRRPVDEAVRLAHEPSLSFPISTLAAFEPATADRPPRLQVRFFGLLGPNGPLPLHLTEFARQRILHYRDRTFARFLDIFHHRFLLLFYRAWAQAQPTVSFDRPREDRFRTYLGALVGLASTGSRDRDAVVDFAKLHFAGLLARQVRNADGLAQILGAYFRVPVRVEPFVGHWMQLPQSERTRLGGRWARLGRDAIVGSSVWDRQHKIRLHLGPLSRAAYEDFLPGRAAAERLVSWLRFYFTFEFAWDVRLVLARAEVPCMQLGAHPARPARLGWTSWLGNRRAESDAGELVLELEGLRASGPAASMGSKPRTQGLSTAH
jgi:type VI secretion system protein ImpH